MVSYCLCIDIINSLISRLPQNFHPLRDHQPTFVWGLRQQSFDSWTGKPAATEAADGDAGWYWEACNVHTNMGWAAAHPTRAPHTQIPRTPWLVSKPKRTDRYKQQGHYLHWDWRVAQESSLIPCACWYPSCATGVQGSERSCPDGRSGSSTSRCSSKPLPFHWKAQQDTDTLKKQVHVYETSGGLFTVSISTLSTV